MVKNDRDLTNEEIKECKSDTVVMEDEECISQMFEYLIKHEYEPKYINVDCKPVSGEHEIELIAHSRLGYDSWNIFNILPVWCRRTKTYKTVRGLITVKFDIGLSDVKENYKAKAQHISLL